MENGVTRFEALRIHDQADRDAISSRRMRFRGRRDNWADIIDYADATPELGSTVVRLLWAIRRFVVPYRPRSSAFRSPAARTLAQCLG
jgi:hypothetical protein